MPGTTPTESKAEIFIDSLINQISAGERELPEGIMNGSAVFVLGNTGAGKSTLINYLAGCEMQRVSGALGSYVSVKETSAVKELVTIGHSKSSETLVPKRVKIGEDIYYDFPGFLDTRGTEFKIANMLNITRAFESSPNIRFVVLVNYHALSADRANGLRKLAAIVSQFFGSSENLEAKKNSLLVGVTKLPLNGEQKNITHLQNFLKDIKEEQEIVNVFAERLFIYDPLDQTNLLKYQSGSDRSALLREISQLDRINEPQNLFAFQLEANEKNRVVELATEISERSMEALQKSNPAEAVRLLNLAKKLEKIPLTVFSTPVTSCKEKIVEFWNTQKQAILVDCAATDPDLDKIEKIFRKLQDDLSKFNPEDQSYFKNVIQYSSIEQTYRKTLQKIEGRKVFAHLQIKKPQLLQAARSQNFHKMYELFVEIVRRVSDFSRKYKAHEHLRQQAEAFRDDCKQFFSTEAEMFFQKLNKQAQLEKEKNALAHKLKLSEEAGQQAKESFEKECERQREEIRKLEKEIADLK